MPSPTNGCLLVIVPIRSPWRKSSPGLEIRNLPQARAPDGRLTTHVLDTSAGRPAASMEIVLYGLDADGRREIKRTVTNADGRCDEPLLAGAS